MAFTVQEQLANIPVVGRETARLTQMLHAWTAADWQRPTYCPGWTAADAVAHLATGGDMYAQVLATGRQGQPILPWGATNVAEFRAARQAASVQLLAGGPATLVQGFEHSGKQLQTVLESLAPTDLTNMAQHPRGMVPIGSWIGMRLMELGVHEWDIHQPHTADIHLAPSLAPALLGVMPEIQCQFLGQRLTEPLDGTYVLQGGALTWSLAIQDKTVTYQDTIPSTYAAKCSTDAEKMILLTVGRADLTEAWQRGTLTITGNTEQGRQLCALLFRTL